MKVLKWCYTVSKDHVRLWYSYEPWSNERVNRSCACFQL